MSRPSTLLIIAAVAVLSLSVLSTAPNSAAKGGCSECSSITAKAATVTINLTPDVYSTALTAGDYFTVSYWSAGVYNTVQDSGSATFTATSDTPVTISGLSANSNPTTGPEWCLQSSCDQMEYWIPLCGVLVTSCSDAATYYYYETYPQSVSVSSLGTPLVSLSYLAMPSVASSSDDPTVACAPLTSTSTQVNAIYSSSASVETSVPDSSGGLWTTSASSWTITGENSIPSPLTYTSGIAANPLTPPSCPTVSATLLDQDQTLKVTGNIPATGTPSYGWTWLVSNDGGSTYARATQCSANSGTGAAGGTPEILTCGGNTLTAGDSYSFELQVNDSETVPETQTSAPSSTVIVSPALGAVSLVAPSAVDADLQPVVMYPTWTGGTAPYTVTISESSSPSDCSSATLLDSDTFVYGAALTTGGVIQDVFAETFTPGTYYLCASVTDGANSPESMSTPSPIELTVNPQFTGTPITLSPSAENIPSGGSATITVSWGSAGTPDYQVSLYSTDAAPFTCSNAGTYVSTKSFVSGTSVTFTVSPASTTLYCAGVKDAADEISDSTSGSMICVPCVSVSSTIYDSSTFSPWSGAETTGASAYDTSAVTGVSGITPTGTVTYSYFTNNGCSGTAMSTDTVTLSSGSVPDSGSVGPLGAGSYSFLASYSGDSNYAGSTGTCEPFTVGQATASVSSVVSPSSTPALGSSVSDTAAVSGVSGFPPSGSVAITLYSGGSCSSSIIATYPSVAFGTPQGVPNQPAGPYSFQATYSGDTDYVSGTTSPCEPFTIQRAQATVSTTVEPSSVDLFGTSTYDTATVGGVVSGFTPTGTVTYSFYSSPGCTGTPSAQTVTHSGGTALQSSSQTLTPGQYSYSASYSGDSNYIGASSGCEPFEVQTPTTTAVACLPLTGTVGVPEYCSVIVANNDLRYNVEATGTVTFGGTLPPRMPTSCTLTGGSGPLSVCTVSWIPPSGGEGTYTITATYGGDPTHASSSSNHWALQISKRSVSVSLSCSGPFQHGKPVTCTVTVTDIGPGTPLTPVGTVSFTSKGSGTFSASSCSLSPVFLGKSSCQVTFTPSSPGAYTVSASYGGDTDHYGGSGSATFKAS